jgi:hypothetical protein
LVGTPAIVIGPLILPGDGGTSSSAAINYRKYRSDAANFMSFTFSMGVSPEVNQFIFSATDAIINLKTQRLNASYFYYIKKKIKMGCSS